MRKKKMKIKIEDQAALLLSEFKEVYEPKNKDIDEIILNGQIELSKGKIAQVVLTHVFNQIYQMVFIDKITVGDNGYELLQKMDRLSRKNGWLPFGLLPPM